MIHWSHVLAHLLKSFIAYKSSSTLFSDNIQWSFQILFSLCKIYHSQLGSTLLAELYSELWFVRLHLYHKTGNTPSEVIDRPNTWDAQLLVLVWVMLLTPILVLTNVMVLAPIAGAPWLLSFKHTYLRVSCVAPITRYQNSFHLLGCHNVGGDHLVAKLSLAIILSALPLPPLTITLNKEYHWNSNWIR